MPSNFVVATTFTGKDRVSSAFKRMGKGAGRFGDSASAAFRKASRQGRNFRSITKGILAAGAIQRGIGLVQRGIGGLLTQFIEFDHAATGAAVRFRDIGPDAADFAGELAKVKRVARDVAAQTSKTAVETAQGLNFMAKAGFSFAESILGLPVMIDLATASGEDFAQVADQSSDLLGAFGLATKNTGQKIKNLIRLNDSLVFAANRANVTVEDQFETMKKAAPIFAIFGDSVEELGALTAIMGNNGIKGSLGATAMANAILNLATPTPKAQAAMDKLGLKLTDIVTITADGKQDLKTFSSILAKMSPLLKKLGTRERAGVLDVIFKRRAIAGTAGLIKMIDEVAAFKTEMIGAAGISKETADIMRKTLKNRLLILGSLATEAGFKFFEAFAVKGKEGIDVLADRVRNFDMGPVIRGARETGIVMGELLGIVKPFAPLLGLAAGAIGLIIKIIRPLTPLLSVVLGAWLAWKGILLAQMAVGWIAFGLTLWKTLNLLVIAQGFLNAVILANPFGIIVVGIAAAIAAVVMLIKHWDVLTFGMGDAFRNMWETTKSAVIKGVKAIGKAFAWLWDNGLKKAFLVPLDKGLALLKSIIGLGAKFGKFLGFDTAAFDSAMEKIEKSRANLEIKINRPGVSAPPPSGRVAKSIAGKGAKVAEFLPIGNRLDKAIGLVKTMAGFELFPPKREQKSAPNKTEIEARQQIGFQGRIDIAGAPEGSKVSAKTTGAPPISMELVGANP